MIILQLHERGQRWSGDVERGELICGPVAGCLLFAGGSGDGSSVDGGRGGGVLLIGAD